MESTTASSKYINKDTQEVYHAKQVISLFSEESKVVDKREALFNDGTISELPSEINPSLGDWLLTSAAGEVTTVKPGDFYKEYTHYFEQEKEGLRIV